MFPYFPNTRHDHATLGHSYIINSGLIHTLITSYIWANIYICSYIQHGSASTTKNILINHTNNELGNAILQKLRKPENFLTPTWRLAVSKLRPTVPAAWKVWKLAFFTVFASPGGVTLAARQFITKKPRMVLLLMRHLAAHSNPPSGFWEFFHKLKNTTIWDYAGHHDHTLQY